ncbi:AraC family transcriptional regulator [Carboxylicivirga sp. RSCT41]|uniref:AraC family transcriptional regulator n=1 Tax=Carboxylicivirga agarovorans TaxID=3417570 RepID=UPI003D333414
MKLKYKSNKSKEKSVVAIERIKRRHFEQNWHYHDEHELIYYLRGKGSRVVGDNLSEFEMGDLVLVGAGLPHLWKNSEEVEKDGLEAVVIKFDTSHPAFNLLSMFEFSRIKQLLSESQRGVKFNDKAVAQVNNLLVSISDADVAMQFILLLQILNILAEQTEIELLASPEFSLPANNSEEYRLNRIIDFLSGNYNSPLTLEDISDEAAMTPNSLCRFFKTRTNKTIFQFLNEYRIGKACELLINGDKSISDVCFDTGFNSLTSFNRVFKELKQVTPRDFKRKYQVLNSSIGLQTFSA